MAGVNEPVNVELEEIRSASTSGVCPRQWNHQELAPAKEEVRHEAQERVVTLPAGQDVDLCTIPAANLSREGWALFGKRRALKAPRSDLPAA